MKMRVLGDHPPSRAEHPPEGTVKRVALVSLGDKPDQRSATGICNRSAVGAPVVQVERKAGPLAAITGTMVRA